MNAPFDASALSCAIAELKAGRPLAAIPLLEEAVSKGDEPELASLNLGMALMDVGRITEATACLEALRSTLAHVPELHIRLGQLAAFRKDLDGARAGFQAALGLRADDVSAMAGLAGVELIEGRATAAAPWLHEALLHAPEDIGLRVRLGEVLLAQGQPGLAAEEAEACLAQDPGSGVAGVLRARALLAADPDAALDQLRAEAADEPFSAGRAAALATGLAACDDAGGALSQWYLADALNPADGDIVAGLALALHAARDWDQAAEALRRARLAKPGDPSCAAALAELHYRQHRLGEADRCYRDALSSFGRRPTILAGFALVLAGRGLQEEAWRIAEEGSVDPGLQALHLGGLAPYHPVVGTAKGLAALAFRLRDALAVDAAPLDRIASDPERRLRIGFLSAAFGKHPVGWLTVAGIEALPRDRFEVVLLSLRDLPGTIARRFHARADRWVDLSAVASDTALVERLRAEELDILVDLSGHGSGGRMMALRRRAAPVQIKWVGSQSGPTGVPEMDWMLADRWEIPEELAPFYTERALRLRDGYVCYAPPSYAPPVAPAPALTRGHVAFGCFNNLAKVTPEVLSAWARILAAVPGSRLAIRTHSLGDRATREDFALRAGALGLPLDRLDLLGPLPHAELLAAYGGIDISLDPFPYTGGLTVCESLWMGVPVLTLTGTSFAGRHALSHLSNVGLADWAVPSVDAYVTEAVRRASDPAALAELRAGLRDRVAASPLCDAPRFGESLALALRQAWREACARDA
jgi:tetratricopeptide (TPR) repeat protein